MTVNDDRVEKLKIIQIIHKLKMKMHPDYFLSGTDQTNLGSYKTNIQEIEKEKNP